MSIYYGDDAITYLAKKAHQQDPKSSSHWDLYHSDFRFDDGEFSGVGGFGGVGREYTGLKKIVHYVFQTPFRRMAKKFPKFNAINESAKDILSKDKQDKGYNLDVLRQVISLAYLEEKKAVKEKGMSCVIGDGFATMTSLLLEYSNQRVVLVNLVKTLLMDLWKLKMLLKFEFNNQVAVVTSESDMLKVLAETEGRSFTIVVEAENHQLMQLCPIDLTINIASMQEMNPVVVSEYFTNISIAAKSNSSLFYCCNRENKVLPDGTVVDFEKYPWSLANKILDDELCPWHLKYYSIKPPFYHNYDGPIRHRLAQFS
jgi:hypothetical protein